MRWKYLVAAAIATTATLQAPTGLQSFSFSARSAQALTAVQLTFEELVVGSDLVIVGTPGESYSLWEDASTGRGSRIVTYTPLSIDDVVDGAAPTQPVWVRTLGGHVGDIGQSVAGEVVFRAAEPSLVFLRRRPDATHGVVGMSQGHFALDGSDPKPNARRILSSPHVDGLVPRVGHTLSEPSAASVVLAGKTLDEVGALVRAERSKHAK